jgi:rod shape-determining protein MreC
MALFLKEKKKPFVLIALILFQFLLISVQLPLGSNRNYFEKAVFSIFSPVQHGIIYFFHSIGNLWKGYLDLRGVKDRNQKMKDEIFFLRQENLLLQNALQKLKKEKDIKDSLSKLYEDILVAETIGLDVSNYLKSTMINKGSMHGVKKDMSVLDEKGNLVGRVIGPISLKEAKVQLITDRESGVGVFSELKGVPGLLSGDGNGMCLFNYVLATNEDITKGEEVITSGKDGIFPSGIKVGRIISIVKDGSLFKRIKVEPYFDVRHLNRVAVILREPMEVF